MTVRSLKTWVASFTLRQLCDYDSNGIPFYLHHEDHSVQCDHDEHCVLKRGRRHEMPQSVLEGLSVLGHVARHWLGADGKVNASPLMGRNEKDKTYIAGETLLNYLNMSVNSSVFNRWVPRSSPGCTHESSCHPALGRWWWSKPQRCWRRRTGRPQSRPRRKQTSPSGCLDLVPCSPL